MAIVGSSVVVGKVAVARLPVFLLSGLRFAVASVILVTLVVLLERPLPRVTRRDLGVLLLQSFAGIFAFNVLLLYGLGYTSAAEGAS
jgi:drug/metabolite transporter (DMT)-like permease